MNVPTNSYWVSKTMPQQLHKVLDVAVPEPYGGMDQNKSSEQYVTTWTVGGKTQNHVMLLPGPDGACWSWYGPASQFLNQFMPA